MIFDKDRTIKQANDDLSTSTITTCTNGKRKSANHGVLEMKLHVTTACPLLVDKAKQVSKFVGLANFLFCFVLLNLGSHQSSHTKKNIWLQIGFAFFLFPCNSHHMISWSYMHNSN